MEAEVIVYCLLALFVGYCFGRAKNYEKQLSNNIKAGLPIVCGKGTDATRQTVHIIQWLKAKVASTGRWTGTWFKEHGLLEQCYTLLPKSDHCGWLNHFILMLAELGLDLVIVKHHKSPYIQQ